MVLDIAGDAGSLIIDDITHWQETKFNSYAGHENDYSIEEHLRIIEELSSIDVETIKFYDRAGQCLNIDRSRVRKLPGGHGGSDPAMRDRLFRGWSQDPLCQMADTRAGAMSIGIGIAANISMREDRAVCLEEFLGAHYPEIKGRK